MTYRIRGLDPAPFRPLYGLSEAELAHRGVLRVAVDECPGFPDRITLRDMALGDHALLLNHVHLDVASPYRASHAIYIREGAETAYNAEDEVPEVMLRRVLSLDRIDRA